MSVPVGNPTETLVSNAFAELHAYCDGLFAVDGRGTRLSLIQEILGTLHFVGRSVCDQEELAVLHLGLILQDTVLRDADAVRGGSECG